MIWYDLKLCFHIFISKDFPVFLQNIYSIKKNCFFMIFMYLCIINNHYLHLYIFYWKFKSNKKKCPTKICLDTVALYIRVSVWTICTILGITACSIFFISFHNAGLYDAALHRMTSQLHLQNQQSIALIITCIPL